MIIVWIIEINECLMWHYLQLWHTKKKITHISVVIIKKIIYRVQHLFWTTRWGITVLFLLVVLYFIFFLALFEVYFFIIIWLFNISFDIGLLVSLFEGQTCIKSLIFGGFYNPRNTVIDDWFLGCIYWLFILVCPLVNTDLMTANYSGIIEYR